MSRTIDLHGLIVDEAMLEFIQFYNQCLESGYRGRIEVIHGYGSSGQGGAIVRALRAYVKSNSSRFESIFHGDDLGNPGITVLYPKEALAELEASPSPVGEAIRRFCVTPKSEQRILAKLRGRFGDRLISENLREMVNRGQLRIVRNGTGVFYEST
ncbi:MAG: Smr/MutS family protein [Anaerolineae bacterium]|nr:Smr/MutS family protein [Anaerolineae bacterium]